jgi:phosphate transport system substrate-binding protein
LALAGGIAWTVFPSRPAAAAVAFRLCGSDALGGRLGFDLVQGFLTRAGGTALEVTPFDATGDATVAADVSGNPTRIAITAAGSSAAYAQIAAGTCQAAIAGRPPTAAELAKIQARYPGAPSGFARPIARDGVVVVVNPGNHINHLSLDAVRRAFTGAAANWSALGGAQLPIAVVAPDEGSDVADVFTSRALGSERITARAARKPTLRAVASAVAHDANAIGLVTFSDSSPAKVVALETPNHRTVPPSVLTIGTTYPLSMQFGLYLPARGDNANADRFVAYLASDDAQNAIGNAGFVPASP